MNIEELTPAQLLNYFPQHQLSIPKINHAFLKENTPLSKVNVHEIIFFKDQYEGHWVLHRTNISDVCLLQVVCLPESLILELRSDAYFMDECVLRLFEEWEELKWDNLVLGDLIQLKNLLSELKLKNQLPDEFERSFNVFSVKEIQAWLKCEGFIF